MKYILAVFMLTTGFYSLTYGLSLWKEDNEKLAGFGAMAVAVLGTIVPIVVLVMKAG
jgi:hypothetical protein